ncbi:hypothetical protein ACOSP7_030046 [Xanthoceras sorbifolium]
MVHLLQNQKPKNQNSRVKTKQYNGGSLSSSQSGTAAHSRLHPPPQQRRRNGEVYALRVAGGVDGGRTFVGDDGVQLHLNSDAPPHMLTSHADIQSSVALCGSSPRRSLGRVRHGRGHGDCRCFNARMELQGGDHKVRVRVWWLFATEGTRKPAASSSSSSPPP